MADYADLELEKIEKEIHKTYTQAQKELQEKWDKYMAKAQLKVDKAYNEYIHAGFHGTAEEVDKAKEKYEKASLNMTLQNAHYQEMVNQTTNKLAETNQIALSYINDQMPKVYCHSYNEFADQHIAGYSFELVNEDAVKYLVKSGNTNLLPQKKLNFEKDKAWNTKQINSEVLQGILQGESMDEISKRLFSVIHDPKETNKNIVHKNEVSARRAAQTMVTGAQNKGRQDSFERANNDGVKMKRIWVAAHDDRTRTSHLDLHGKSVAVDEPFHSMYGDIMYPGDPTADPRDVYNCRCAIRVKVLGFDWSKQPEPEYKSAYADQYQGTGVTAQYCSMLDENKALGNEFWKLLNANGKPSAVWKDYLAGNTAKTLTKEIDDVLAKYKGTGQAVKPGSNKLVLKDEYINIDNAYKLKAADWDALQDIWLNSNEALSINNYWKAYKAGKIKNKDLDDIFKVQAGKKASVVVQEAPKPDLGMYQDKSMTATFYSVKAENKDLGKEFWDILQSADKPSDTWKQYLIGTAPKEITEKLDKILLQHKGEGAWTKPVSAKKAASKVNKADDLVLKEEYENINTITDFFKIGDDDAYEILKEAYKKDKTFEGPSTSAYWQAYKSGKIKNKDLDDVFKESKLIQEAEKKAEKKAVENLEKYEQAKSQLAIAEGNLNSIPNTTYVGIWKDPVSLSDYEAKAGSIAAKKEYYYGLIDDLQGMAADGEISKIVASTKIAKYEKYLDDLVDFETQGKLYVQYAKEYQKAFDEVRKLTPVSETFGPDAYSISRKNAALWAKDHAQYKDLDKYYDKVAKKVHADRTDIEYEGYRHYTWGSGPFNRPLAGFDGSWNANDFVGPGKVDIDKGGYGDKIRGLTSLCEKSKYDRDIWVQSGQTTETLEGFLKIPYGSLRDMTEAELQQFVGVEKEIPQFISGAINKGGGSYTPGNMLFNIYCPSGSEMLYVRSDGYFGKNEHEMILQRGGTYKITKIYWGKDTTTGSKKLIVDLELHPEKGYNKFQQKK